MSLVKTTKGVLSAVTAFLVVGVVFPYLLEYFSPKISSYLLLPPADEVWAVFLAIGAVFAVTGFLQSAYSKGDYPWLFGRLGRGIVSIVLFTYLFSLLLNSASSAGFQTSDLLYLIYLAIALSYGYLILDFFDARRSRPFKPKETDNIL
jgi:hypothetical protein